MTTPPRVRSLLEAGMKAYAGGRTEDAKAAFEEALRLDPESPAARNLVRRLFPAMADAAAAPKPEAKDEAPPGAPSPWVEDGASEPAAKAPTLADRQPWGIEGDKVPELDWGASLADAWGPGAPGDAPEETLDTDALAAAPDDPWDEAAVLKAPAAPALDLLVEPAPAAEPPTAPPAAEPVPEAPEATADEVAQLMDGARELFELADFTGSLELVEKALALDPGNADAQDYLERNEGTLLQMYESKVGPLDRKPRMAVSPDEVVWLNLDHRAGFVLAQIDGTVTYEDVFALSGMSRLDTCRILVQLLDESVIVAD